MQAGVAMLDNFSCTEDCMAVHKKTLEKGAMFETYRAQYMTHFEKNNELEQKRQGVAIKIQQNLPAFQQLVANSLQDPAKTAFFTQLNEALVA